MGKRHPDEIMREFDEGAAGLGDIDMRGVLWEVIDDVIDSFELAMKSRSQWLDPEDRSEMLAEVRDYVINHYGDD